MSVQHILDLLSAPPGEVDYKQLATEFVFLCKTKAGTLVLDEAKVQAELNDIDRIADAAISKIQALPKNRVFIDAIIAVAIERFPILWSAASRSTDPDYAGQSSPVHQFADACDKCYRNTPPTRHPPKAPAVSDEETQRPPARHPPKAPVVSDEEIQRPPARHPPRGPRR